jgi:hypothetical protein
MKKSKLHLTAFAIAIYPCARNGQHHHRPVERWRSTMILSPWHLSSVGTDQQNHYGRNKVKVAPELVMMYMKLKWSNMWTAEILKFENAYANASANTNEYGRNVDLACRLGYMRNAQLVRQVDSRRDRCRFAPLAMVPKGAEVPASALRIFDNIRA